MHSQAYMHGERKRQPEGKTATVSHKTCSKTYKTDMQASTHTVRHRDMERETKHTEGKTYTKLQSNKIR